MIPLSEGTRKWGLYTNTKLAVWLIKLSYLAPIIESVTRFSSTSILLSMTPTKIKWQDSFRSFVISFYLHYYRAINWRQSLVKSISDPFEIKHWPGPCVPTYVSSYSISRHLFFHPGLRPSRRGLLVLSIIWSSRIDINRIGEYVCAS